MACGFLIPHFCFHNGEAFVEGLGDVGGVVFGEAHGGFDADDVSVEAAFAEEELAFAGEFEEFEGFGVGGFFGVAVADEFDAEHEAQAADFADEGVFVHEVGEESLR